MLPESRSLIEKPAACWNPYGLVSLWTMIWTVAAKLVSIWPRLQELAWGFDMSGEHAVTPEEARGTLGLVIELCGDVGWLDLAMQATRLLHRAEEGQRGEPMMILAEDLRHAFENKLGNTYIVIVEQRDTELWKDTAKHLCGSLHPNLSISEAELNLAGKALSTGLGTASVLHAMRSVEASLHVICRVLGITFPGTVELTDWLNLTEKIKRVIDALQQQQTRSPQKTEQLKRLSELMIPADGFRLAWRNHAAHAREKYETEEARAVLGHVAGFLKKLSAAILKDVP